MNQITLKGIIDEDFINYRIPSMTLMFPKCSFKCGTEYCQNSSLSKSPDITLDIADLCKRYINNTITHAIVCQGLEPFDSFSELQDLIWYLRDIYYCSDDIVIYTGYDKDEIKDKLETLLYYSPQNIIIKFGRYIPDQNTHYDPILGVNLTSNNQYAERIS